jgi:hypothetical protein
MTRPKPIIAGILASLVLLGAYMGSYYAMLDYIGPRLQPPWESPYRVEGMGVYRFYSPARWIDKNLRPARWKHWRGYYP